MTSPDTSRRSKARTRLVRRDTVRAAKIPSRFRASVRSASCPTRRKASSPDTCAAMTEASGRSSAVGLGTCSGQTERSKRTFPELVAAYGLRARTSLSGDALDDLDQFVYA